MASFINSKMVATGKTYLSTCRPTQLFTGTCIEWREAGAIVQLMSVLHEQVREQVKKRKVWGVAPPPPNLFKRTAKWTTLIIIDFSCCTKHL